MKTYADLNLDPSTMVSNIISIFDQARMSELIAGQSWYLDANEYVSKLADEFQYSVACLSAALAALSPRNEWERNKSDLRCLLVQLNPALAHEVDLEVFADYKFGAFPEFVVKAVGILEDYRNQHYMSIELMDRVGKVTANKVRNFADLIYKPVPGNDSVCIDTHAISVSQGKRCLQKTTIKVFASTPRYNLVAQAYRDAAFLLNNRDNSFGKISIAHLTAFDLQAITWLTWKRLKGI